jgi:hypothetical protein
MVPEPHNAESLAFQLGRSLGVLASPESVLAAVDLDDEVLFEADEIDHVGSDGALAAELVAGEGPVAEA